jgi:4'-phosphopantetheinyl transferase
MTSCHEVGPLRPQRVRTSVSPRVHVSYRLTGDLSDGDVRAAVAQLSPEEQERQARFRLANDRRDFAAAHALLRQALSEQEPRPPRDWIFVAGGNGKPHVAPGLAGRRPLSFNLAHTDGLVACAVTRDADVGIDVERIDRRTDALALADRYFSPIEIAQLERCPEDERQARFIEIWTLKEAYVKATGDGLSLPLQDFAFVFDGLASFRFVLLAGDHSETWHFGLFRPSDQHRLAVAVREW